MYVYIHFFLLFYERSTNKSILIEPIFCEILAFSSKKSSTTCVCNFCILPCILCSSLKWYPSPAPLLLRSFGITPPHLPTREISGHRLYSLKYIYSNFLLVFYGLEKKCRSKKLATAALLVLLKGVHGRTSASLADQKAWNRRWPEKWFPSLFWFGPFLARLKEMIFLFWILPDKSICGFDFSIW